MTCERGRKYYQAELAAETEWSACCEWSVRLVPKSCRCLPPVAKQRGEFTAAASKNTASLPTAKPESRAISVPPLGAHRPRAQATRGETLGRKLCRTIRTLRGVCQVIDRVGRGKPASSSIWRTPFRWLERASSVLEFALLLVFMKHAAHRVQREYRFAVWGRVQRGQNSVNVRARTGIREPRERATNHSWSVVETSHELCREARRPSTCTFRRFSAKIAA